MISKLELDDLVEKYETADFIADDPIQFPHRFENKCDAEISALITSCLAYGKREKIIEAVEYIHQIMENQPYKYCLGFDLEKNIDILNGFRYRYTNGLDVTLLLYFISCSLKKYDSLENHFMSCYNLEGQDLKGALAVFVGGLMDFAPRGVSLKGVRYLLPNSKAGSACKRLNLFLRWMVRKPPVDLNLWENIPASKLVIPVDVHVARVSRGLGFTSRKSNDWKTAQEITNVLKKYDPNDPVRYDFALFGLGINLFS